MARQRFSELEVGISIKLMNNIITSLITINQLTMKSDKLLIVFTIIHVNLKNPQLILNSNQKSNTIIGLYNKLKRNEFTFFFIRVLFD